MVFWSQPLGAFLLSRFTAAMCLGFIINFLEYTREGITTVFYAISILIVASVVFYLVVKRKLGALYDHEMSRWIMRPEEVLRRLEVAMRERGVQVALERDGDRVMIPLPPLSIVVAPGWWRTKVFAGPSTDENELLVYRLKVWIEVALRTA